MFQIVVKKNESKQKSARVCPTKEKKYKERKMIGEDTQRNKERSSDVSRHKAR